MSNNVSNIEADFQRLTISAHVRIQKVWNLAGPSVSVAMWQSCESHAFLYDKWEERNDFAFVGSFSDGGPFCVFVLKYLSILN